MSPQQVERWLGGSNKNPNEVSKKTKLNTMFVKIEYKASREAFHLLMPLRQDHVTTVFDLTPDEVALRSRCSRR